MKSQCQAWISSLKKAPQVSKTTWATFIAFDCLAELYIKTLLLKVPYILVVEYKTINFELTKKHPSFWLALIVPESAMQAFREEDINGLYMLQQ